MGAQRLQSAKFTAAAFAAALAVVLAIIFTPSYAQAETVASGNCGANGSNVTWTLDDSGLLSIQGQGAMDDWIILNPPWYSREKQVKEVRVSEGVTTIGTGAFWHCSELRSAVLPESAKSIGINAFNGCGKLQTISLPEGITTISMYAFYNCSNLQAIYIPAAATYIPQNAFDSCESLADVYYGGPEDSQTLLNFGWASDYLVNATWHYNHVHADAPNADTRTCTEGMVLMHDCACGKRLAAPENLPALGHAWGEGSVTTDPTCLEKGVRTYTCGRCGATRTEDVPALGHDYAAVVTPPTCLEGGYTTHTCSVCGDSYTDSEVAPLGHDYVAVVTEPTCTDGGYTTHTCSVCGDSYVDSETVPLGHDWDKGTVTTDPTCLDEGVRTFTCGTCGDTYTEAVPALGHDYESVVTPPTCLEGGYTTHTCSVCGDSYTDSETAALGHDWDKGAVTTEPTCVDEGIRTFTCGCCGDTYTEAVPALGHVWKSGFTVDKQATYAAAGSKSIHCSVCDAKKDVTAIPKLAKTALSKCTVTLSSTVLTYNGKVRKPTVTVKNGSKTIASTAYTVTYETGCKSVGTHKVTVTAKSGNYPISGSKTLTFKIRPKGTSLSSLTKGPQSFTAEWKMQDTKMASSRITGYQIQYSTGSGFASGSTVSKKVSGYSNTALTVSNLTILQGYYVRIRTYKKVDDVTYYSTWSSSKYVVTDPPVTTPPAKASITSAKALSLTTAKVTWGSVSKAVGYQVKYATDSSFTNPSSVYTTGTSASLSGLTANMTYCVKVRAYKKDYYGKKVYGSWSAVSTFRTVWNDSATAKYNSYMNSGISKLNAAASYAKKVANLSREDLDKTPSYLASARSNVNAAKSYFQKARDFAAGNPRESRTAIANCKTVISNCTTVAANIKANEDKAQSALDKGNLLTLRVVTFNLYGVNAWDDINSLLSTANKALL